MVVTITVDQLFAIDSYASRCRDAKSYLRPVHSKHSNDNVFVDVNGFTNSSCEVEHKSLSC